MRRGTIVVLLLAFAGLAWGAYTAVQPVHMLFKDGITIGSGGEKIDDSYSASSTIDFDGVTDLCEDSDAITVTGAEVGDGCVVGPPSTMPGAESWLTCYVSAANAVKVRHCSHGASGDPDAGTYSVRVFDP